MIGSLISAGVGIAGGISGKAQEAKRRRSMDKWIDKQSAEAKAYYDRESNTDMVDTAEGSSAVQGLRKMLRENNKRVDNSAIQTGATAESAIAAKEQANNTLSEGMSSIAALGGQRKQALRSQYMQQKSNLDGLKYQNMSGAADASGNMASNMFGLGTQSLASFGADGGFKALFKKKGATA